MRRVNKLTVVLLAVLAALVGHSVMAFRSRQQHPPNSSRKINPTKDREQPDFEQQFPVVDYDSPETNDSRREERKNKSKRYNRFGFVSKDSSSGGSEVIRDIPWQERIAGLPAKRSVAVVIGEVQNASAHLSNDKSGVYTELTILIERVLKGDDVAGVAVGHAICVDRPGGRVRYANGRERLYRIFGMNMPVPGKRYVLFLSHKLFSDDEPESPNLHVLTGYELSPTGVMPLDVAPHFDFYKGMDEASFLKAVSDAIARP